MCGLSVFVETTQTVLYYIYLSLFYVLLEAVHVIHTLCVVYAIPKGQCTELITTAGYCGITE